LILLFHPDLRASRVNRALYESVKDVNGIFHQDVYAKYPDFDIDVTEEQALCQEHDVIVFQHPIQWYSCPALMKEWIDRVLTYGWAHGPDGTKLQGKSWLSAASAGWSEPDYRPDGRNRTFLREFLLPLTQTAAHCGMLWLEPVILYGARHADAAKISAHASSYREHLLALRDGNG
jgi:putative NADPH-quinone reductase